MLDTRELATLIVLAAAVVLVVLYPQTRRVPLEVASVLANRVLVVPLVLMVLWVTTVVYLAASVNLWTTDFLTATLFWFAAVGITSLFDLNKAKEDEQYFRRKALATLKLTLLLEFYVNLHTQHLLIEVILQATVVALGALAIVASMKPETQNAKAVADVLIALIGLYLLVSVTIWLVDRWRGIDLELSLKELILPIWLTVGLLPFVYALSIYASYDWAFRTLAREAPDRASLWRGRLALVLGFRLHRLDVARVSRPCVVSIANASSIREGIHAVKDFRTFRAEERRRAQDKAESLRCYAGSEGVDGSGRRLDTREFEETRKALRYMWTCQAGWHRNRGGRYRPELLSILAQDFVYDGLPVEHGVNLNVAPDGQSWWAWRRTVTGWCFGIGAAGPPPSEFLFDGPEPPTGFPGQDEAWGEEWGLGAINW